MKIINMKKCLSDHSDGYFFCIKSIFIVYFMIKNIKEETIMTKIKDVGSCTELHRDPKTGIACVKDSSTGSVRGRIKL